MTQKLYRIAGILLLEFLQRPLDIHKKWNKGETSNSLQQLGHTKKNRKIKIWVLKIFIRLLTSSSTLTIAVTVTFHIKMTMLSNQVDHAFVYVFLWPYLPLSYFRKSFFIFCSFLVSLQEERDVISGLFESEEEYSAFKFIGFYLRYYVLMRREWKQDETSESMWGHSYNIRKFSI